MVCDQQNHHSMSSEKKPRRVTSMDIMIVVAVIALVISVVVPNYLRARKRAQAMPALGNSRQSLPAASQAASSTLKPAL
jgi:competence protein ComGC